MHSSSTELSEKDGLVSQADVDSGRCLEKHLGSAIAPQQSLSIGVFGISQGYLKAKVKEKNLQLCLYFVVINRETPPSTSAVQTGVPTLSSRQAFKKFCVFSGGFAELLTDHVS